MNYQQLNTIQIPTEIYDEYLSTDNLLFSDEDFRLVKLKTIVKQLTPTEQYYFILYLEHNCNVSRLAKTLNLQERNLRNYINHIRKKIRYQYELTTR